MAPSPGPGRAQRYPFHDRRPEAVGGLDAGHSPQVTEKAGEFLETGPLSRVGGEYALELAGFVGRGLPVEHRLHEPVEFAVIHGQFSCKSCSSPLNRLLASYRRDFTVLSSSSRIAAISR